MYAITKCEERDFVAYKTFFQNNGRGGVRTDKISHRSDSSNSFGAIFCDHHSFARCQSVCLYDDRARLITKLAGFEELDCLLRRGCGFVKSCRNAVAGHKIFCKRFAALKSRRGLRRTDDPQLAVFELINNTQY